MLWDSEPALEKECLMSEFGRTNDESYLGLDFDTLESYIANEQQMHAHSRGLFSNILRRVGLASKIISAKVQRAGLLDVLGTKGSVNVQGEEQMKLDDIANEVMKRTFFWMPSIAGIASEEEDDFVAFSKKEGHTGHRYTVVFDPLDGSSNIDANVSVGTIFAVYRCLDPSGECSLNDFLQPGTALVAAGYVIYGSSTMLVFTTGHGVHGFTLDPEIGEFVLSHENLKIPDRCKCFSVNAANHNKWDEGTKRFVDYVRQRESERYQETTSRYIGSLVADFHRNMLYGGIFLYPKDISSGKGKLRLLYECAPLALLAEQAGGAASSGDQRVLDIVPTELHQRIPYIVGNKRDVELYERMYREQ